MTNIEEIFGVQDNISGDSMHRDLLTGSNHTTDVASS